VAGAQIVGGLAATWVRNLVKLRTSVLLAGEAVSVGFLLALGIVDTFWGAVTLLCLWGLTFAALAPVRQAYLNNLIPSQQRATVLSFDSLLSSAGGMFTQPYLGRVADLFGYFRSFTAGAFIHAVAVPLTWLAQRQEAAQTSPRKRAKRR
jgi:MFS family permease